MTSSGRTTDTPAGNACGVASDAATSIDALGSGLGEAAALVDAVLGRGVEMFDSGDAAAALRAVERLRRKVAAVAVAVQVELDRSGVHVEDGHHSAKVMSRHVASLSPGEATARAREAGAARDLQVLAGALADGELGVAQFGLLARVHANPRVREAMVDAQHWFLDRARSLSFSDFEQVVRQWERLVDADGAEPANSRNHDRRRADLFQDPFDLSWHLDGRFGAMQGASLHDIFDHYVSAERLADWEKARAEHGDEATAADLARTEGQRRADALWQIFQDAAGADGSAVPVGFVHNVVWDAAGYQEMLARLDGDDAHPLDVETFRCSTIDGIPLEPVEAAVASLTQQFRRVVVDSAGVVIDMGRARRFTGLARLAVQIPWTHCPWPGCAVPASRCEIDHTVDHSHGGPTNPGNGGPFCGRHNRLKQAGFTVWRDPAGEWHTYRPDGSEIT